MYVVTLIETVTTLILLIPMLPSVSFAYTLYVYSPSDKFVITKDHVPGAMFIIVLFTPFHSNSTTEILPESVIPTVTFT